MQMNTVTTREDADTLIAQWRQSADDQHPAGPLFAGGEFAEADIVGDIVRYTGMCGTDCSGSHTRYCC
jgi:hypothetical protein